ncbi:hypothetical protein Barb7_02848 [Bacteroidales bacterium Barb7]|nr:hypothetical protein Barb7_02848 [Bacteroidales bacterium Barb7]
MAPRKRINELAPGAPVFFDINRPGTAPCNFSVILAEGTLAICSTLTVVTAAVMALLFDWA